jgi:hypothetical protein
MARMPEGGRFSTRSSIRVGLGPVLHGVVAEKKIHQPRIGFLFGGRRVKVVERLVHLLDGAEGPLNLAF